MGATSVTGISGPGDSHGEYKPELHCGGCGCGSGEDEEPATPVRKRGCYTNSSTGSRSSINVGSSSGIRVC